MVPNSHLDFGDGGLASPDSDTGRHDLFLFSILGQHLSLSLSVLFVVGSHKMGGGCLS